MPERSSKALLKRCQNKEIGHFQGIPRFSSGSRGEKEGDFGQIMQISHRAWRNRKYIMVFTWETIMIAGMILRRVQAICTAAILAMAGSICIAGADIPADNPYLSIVHRNPFGLKDPPPPPPPQVDTAPAVPPAKVVLTGLLHMFGEPKALLEIYDEPAKGGTPKRPSPMRVGERNGAVEILAIDVEKNMVRIKNSELETNLTFEVAKTTGIPGAPTPAAPTPLPTTAAAYQHPGPGSPTVVGNNANSGGGGVTLVGGASSSPTPGAAAYGGAQVQSAAATGVPGALGMDSGLRSIPSRPLRTDAANGSVPPMTREQAQTMISVQNAINAQKGFPPLPGGNPNIDQQLADPNGGQNPRFPSFPAPPTRPPGFPAKN